jgi:hypothetical protein
VIDCEVKSFSNSWSMITAVHFLHEPQHCYVLNRYYRFQSVNQLLNKSVMWRASPRSDKHENTPQFTGGSAVPAYF